ncbi:MAG: hypothetical protein KY439_01350 [Actinobacteria bacterium]|nr:hypothetical protein [Actinomycetota bacterium]
MGGVEIRAVGDRSAVTFEAQDHDRTVKSTYVVEEANWELGDHNVAFMDEDGRVHEDQQFGLAGVPLLMPVVFVLGFATFAARRLWGLVIASWDVSNHNQRPRLGYAALIDDPAPRTVRPLLAVWERDPVHALRPPRRRGAWHQGIARMVLRRLLAVVAAIGLALLQVDDGHPVESEQPKLRSAAATDAEI